MKFPAWSHSACVYIVHCFLVSRCHPGFLSLVKTACLYLTSLRDVVKHGKVVVHDAATGAVLQLANPVDSHEGFAQLTRSAPEFYQVSCNFFWYTLLRSRFTKETCGGPARSFADGPVLHGSRSAGPRAYQTTVVEATHNVETSSFSTTLCIPCCVQHLAS